MHVSKARFLVLLMLLTSGWPALPSACAQAKLPVELALIPQDAFAFVHIRPADLAQCELAVKLRKSYWIEDKFVRDVIENAAGHAADGIDSISLVYPRMSDLDDVLGMGRARPRSLKSAALNPTCEVIVVTTTAPCDRLRILRNAFGDNFVERKYKDSIYYTARESERDTVHFVNNRTFLFESSPSKKQILARSARARGPLAAALDLAASKCPLVVGLNLAEPSAQERKRLTQISADERRRFSGLEFEDASVRFLMMPDVEPLLLQFTPLLEARSLVLWATLGNSVRLQGNVDFAGPAQAQAAAEALEDVLRLARMGTVGRFMHQLRSQALHADTPHELLFWSLVLGRVDRSMRDVVVECRQATLRFVIDAPLDLDALQKEALDETEVLKKTEAYRQARLRRDSASNMRQILAGMLAYEKEHRTLPPAALCAGDGKPLLSWRVALLPYLGQNELYRQFKLDEPWDSDANLKLLAKIPSVYGPVGAVPTEQPFATFYQVVAGPGTLFGSHQAARGAKLASVGRRDRTVGLVEALDAVSWTRPGDVVVEAKKPLPRFGGLFADGFHAAYLDGSVRFFADAVDQTLSWKMMTVTTKAGE